MADNEEEQGLEDKDIVETLLRLPVKNLESRIKQLQKDIKTRQKLSNHALSKLGTQRFNLEEKVWQQRYIGLLGHNFKEDMGFASQLLKLKQSTIYETHSCFRDISEFKEKLHHIQEEFEMARQKLRLIEE